MATTVYDAQTLFLINDEEMYITPLKIKYLRQVMDRFSDIKKSENKDEYLDIVLDCATIAMKQYYPSIKTVEQLEDSMDMPTVYKILEYGAGIKLRQEDIEDESKTIDDIKEDSEGTSWDELDLAKLESEAFLLGIWKDYEDLETSLSMPELMKTITAKREDNYNDKKFMAAIQGVDIEKDKKDDAWEKLKARAFSRGQTSDPNDVLALQGQNAAKAGFGIGNGLSYERIG